MSLQDALSAIGRPCRPLARYTYPIRRWLPTLVLGLALGFAVSPASAAGWMRRLPDATFVAALSIPGAHDAATGEGFGPYGSLGDEFARTQELSVARQWSIGIRAFDLRPAAYEDHLHLHHGIISTAARLDSVMLQLRDSLVANPSEFVIVHLLHERDGDQADTYDAQLLALLRSDQLSPYLADFRKDLTVGEMRGKMLILSRDRYATQPIGGFFEGWTGTADWERMTAARIVGPGSNNSSGLYVQDYSDTHAAGGISTKVSALTRLLTYSFGHRNARKTTITWYLNFASAYSLVASIFGNEVSTSDGYRDNAAHTHRAILDFIAGRRVFGPTGIVLMDYVGVDQSGDFQTLGQEVVDAIIENNFRYLDDITPVRTIPADAAEHASAGVRYDLQGRPLPASQPARGLYIESGRKHVAR